MKIIDRLEDSEDNKSKLELLENEFSAYFISRNYHYTSPLPITSQEDPSVQFVGSSTNTFKKTLSNGTEFLNFSIQPCFRSRNINELLDEKSPFKWGSLFTMFGTMGPPTSYNQQCNDIFSFITEIIGIPADQLYLQVHPDDQHLITPWKDKTGLNFETGGQPETYYRWKYGKSNLLGKGVSLAKKSKKDGNPLELGNIIEISKNNTPITVEMGFGLECLITRIEDKDHTIEATQLAGIFNLNDNPRKKFADAVMVCMTLVQNSISPNGRGQGRVLREYIKGIVFSIITSNLPKATLVDILLKIEISLTGKHSGIASTLYNYIFDLYENIISNCSNIGSQTNKEIIKLLKRKDK